MNQAKQWFSAAELAEMKLTGLPTSERRIRTHAQKNLWVGRTKVRGKGLEYQPPKAILQQIQHKTMTAMLQAAPTAPAVLTTLPILKNAVTKTADNVIYIAGLTRRVKAEDHLTDKDRARRDAALVLCRAIDDAVIHTHCSVTRAIQELAPRILSFEAHPELISAAQITYSKPRASGQTAAALISRLQKMFAAYEQGKLTGDVGRYLVVGSRQKEGHSPLLIKAFLLHFCHPSRPPIMEAWKNSAAWFAHHGLTRPAVDTFYRIEKSLPVTVKYRGRVTGSAWRSLMPYVARDVSMFKANDIWVGDGHSFKAKVQHPIHGQAFTPEITLIRDWVSRRIVGWSVDLAESTIAVSAALKNAMQTTGARPLVYYSDNGSGQTAKQLDSPVHGTLARFGIAHETGIPGNPQGRGIIERLWADTLIPLARTYPTYQGKGGDAESIRKMLVDLNRKAPKTLLPAFMQLLEDVPNAIDDYNNRPHSALNKLTPNEAYAKKLDLESVGGITEQELDTMWMPEEIRIPQRGIVSIFNNEYAMPDLVNLLAEGEQVRVRFDIHDANQVTLLRMDGRLIGIAHWDGHKRAAFPVAFIEQKRQERMEGKIKRAERDIKKARAELGNTVEGEVLQAFAFPVKEKAPELVRPDWTSSKKKDDEITMPYNEVAQWLYGEKQDKELPKNEVAAG